MASTLEILWTMHHKSDSLSKGTSAGLAIVGRDLDPEAVSERLQLMPSRSWARGSEARTRGGRRIVRQRGLWSYECGDGELNESISCLLATVGPRKRELVDVVRGAPDSSVFLSFFPEHHGPVETSSSSLIELVGLAPTFHVYFFGIAGEKDDGDTCEDCATVSVLEASGGRWSRVVLRADSGTMAEAAEKLLAGCSALGASRDRAIELRWRPGAGVGGYSLSSDLARKLLSMGESVVLYF